MTTRHPLLQAIGPSAAEFAAQHEWQAQLDGGVIAVGVGHPISSRVAGLAGTAALDRIARLVLSGELRVLAEFDGPFVVVLHDMASGRVLVARDRYGERSAFWQRLDDGTLLVTDEIHRLPGTRVPRVTAVTEWLHWCTPIEPETFFQPIQAVPGGCLLELQARAPARVQRWFSADAYVDARQYERTRSMTMPQAVQEYLSIFTQAVREQVGGAREISMMLSGGIDSSLLAAVTRESCQVHAVTVDLHGPGAFSEVQFARGMAKAFGPRVQLTEVRFGPRDYVAGFCRTVHDLAQPLLLDNTIALEHAARSGAVPRGQLILDGEGADGLLGGAGKGFKYSMMLRHVGRITGMGAVRARAWAERARDIVERFGLSTRSSLDGRGLDVDLLGRGIELSAVEAHLNARLAHLDREDREITAYMLRESWEEMVALIARIEPMSRTAQAHTLLPYLARPVVEFIQNLPMDLKIATPSRFRMPVTKALSKVALERFAPRDLIYRPKVGFGIPGSSWITMPDAWRDDLWLAETYRLSRPAMDQYFANLKTRDNLFVCSLEVWGRLFARGVPLEQVEHEWIEHNERQMLARGIVSA